MSRGEYQMGRRELLKLIAGLAGGYWIAPAFTYAADRTPIRKAIPSTNEMIPVIGLGTSRTFDSAGDPDTINNLGKVLETFFKQGGSLIDSSPMYGSSEQVIGTLLKTANKPKSLFAATKVWTDGKAHGVAQMALSKKLWGIQHFDLMQIHNLRDWRTHLETLKVMKAEGDIRYVGVTTSHGRSHDELFEILSSHPFDFVQLSYNIGNREVEKRLLPLASERGIAVIANRPYARGSLFRQTKGKAMPDWVDEFGCNSWGQFFLKYAVSHPAITCAIPATSKVHHMIDNMEAGFGQLPDRKMRKKMEATFDAL
ncbi:MAG: aldo/keto reductase [Candidatus Thiodiazotropha sp. (ex Lucinoma annulata)]|nr:aldo/keto reductase [Candidatus Thiodiazotropha sp. (ex Lucinoma borealis)]MCU7841220.1 aldo/keto reductase [Candidatus Thiodiazotropha sp. (ex Troendleina suluensis)]MCU7882851.1 aldo/keto reductase [Candidatus Thiodiazotropha sp. (ex Lucinoma annulata)]MCU7857858.1 aldo/keto reductase [Candidatus Thiodiazotropha sp. (ex Lucinoma borealis)]MCU7865168.1 aldo/keto reductase [Candidatus Thiodiazotropha sp. (ex Lucinoma borealis)]